MHGCAFQITQSTHTLIFNTWYLESMLSPECRLQTGILRLGLILHVHYAEQASRLGRGGKSSAVNINKHGRCAFPQQLTRLIQMGQWRTKARETLAGTIL